MGFFSKAKGYARKGVEKYKEYESKQPERQKARIERLKRDEEEQRLKGRIAKSRFEQRKYSPFAQMGGGGGGSGPGAVADYLTGTGGGFNPVMGVAGKPKRVGSRKKRKGSGSKSIVIKVR